MTTRNKLIKFLWKYSLKNFDNGEIGEEYDEYPAFLADKILEEFSVDNE
mgnify:CR=1 FL=1